MKDHDRRLPRLGGVWWGFFYLTSAIPVPLVLACEGGVLQGTQGARSSAGGGGVDEEAEVADGWGISRPEHHPLATQPYD